MTKPWQLAVIIGSVRDGRIGHSVARWFVNQVRDDPRWAVELDVIDLMDLRLPDDLSGGGDAGTFAERVDRADAVVVITPEYNRGYPGPLKTAIDTVVSQWSAKPVGFVAYGGVSGGLRAVEQLRPVFAELHAVTVQAVVTLPYAWDLLDPDETLNAPRAQSATATMLGQLTWWACALREARTSMPYGSHGQPVPAPESLA